MRFQPACCVQQAAADVACRSCERFGQRRILSHLQPALEVIDDSITECGYGAWQNRKLAELAKEELWATVQTQPSAVTFPEGESMATMQARAVAAIRGHDAEVDGCVGPCRRAHPSGGDPVRVSIAAGGRGYNVPVAPGGRPGYATASYAVTAGGPSACRKTGCRPCPSGGSAIKLAERVP